MKGKINKIFATTALAAALAIGSIVPTFASSTELDTSSTNTTDVKIGVTTSIKNVKQVSVTVPTVVTLAVIASGEEGDEQDAPYVLVGSNSDSSLATGNVGTGSLTFTNKSTDGNGTPIDVKVQSATVTVQGGTNWRLVNATEESESGAYGLQLTIDGKEVVSGEKKEATQGDTVTVVLDKTLDANDAGLDLGQATTVSLGAAVGGTESSYTETEDLASALTISWYITTDAE